MRTPLTSTLLTYFAALCLVTATACRGGIVTWGSPNNITADTDVSTNGILVDARDAGGSNTFNINGVPFGPMGINGSVPSVTAGSFTLAGIGGDISGDATGAPPGLSLPYRSMLFTAVRNAGFDPLVPIALTMNGLTVGNVYEFEWWCHHPGTPAFQVTATAGNSVTLQSRTGGGLDPRGQFAIGTFVADSSTQVITFTSPQFGPEINGFQLRNLGAIPEPATAFFGLAMVGMVMLRRR